MWSDGMRTVDIAKTLGCTSGSVLCTLSRAKKKIAGEQRKQSKTSPAGSRVFCIVKIFILLYANTTFKNRDEQNTRIEI